MPTSDPLDALRRLGGRNKRAVADCCGRVAEILREHVPNKQAAEALACSDRAIETLRGTPAKREAVLGTLEAIGTQVQPGAGGFRRTNKPTIRPRRRGPG